MSYLTDVKEHRSKNESKAIKLHPQDYGEGVLKGAEVYEQGHTYQYISGIVDKQAMRRGSAVIGAAYCCGLWEGWNESEQNDISIN